MTNKDNFYLKLEEPNQSCFLALKEIILAMDENITETIKYGAPCFCYFNKIMCYLWRDKKSNEPYILMVEGKHLHHPKLEKGDRKRMKILRIDPNKDIDIELIHIILEEALDLYRNGQIKFKK
jgi:hypothetical protein